MERYVIRGGRFGYERLRVLARFWAPSTSALLDRIGLAPGMNCLDVGCGGGDVTVELARRVGPGGRACGVDMDDVKLELARQGAAEQGMSNVDFRMTDVYEWAERGWVQPEWAEPGGYDVVYARLVLEHLSRPVEVLRAMWAAVRPGGVIVVEDADFLGCFSEPPNDGYAFWLESYLEVVRQHGGDPVCSAAGCTGTSRRPASRHPSCRSFSTLTSRAMGSGW